MRDTWLKILMKVTSWFDSRNIKVAMRLASESNDDFRIAAVVAKDFRILSTGVRGRKNEGESTIHAEREAIEALEANQLKGSTLYTTLEPCVDVYPNQKTKSCSTLISNSGIQRVVIGVLDPRGDVYTLGWRRLLDESIDVDFFPDCYREKIDSEYLRESSATTAYGPSSKPWTIVPDSGVNFTIYKNRDSDESITFSWQTIQSSGPCVDIAARSEGNHSITMAANMKSIGEISNWRVFRNWGHTERLCKGNVVIARKNDSSWAVLLRILTIEKYSIHFHYRVCDY